MDQRKVNKIIDNLLAELSSDPSEDFNFKRYGKWVKNNLDEIIATIENLYVISTTIRNKSRALVVKLPPRIINMASDNPNYEKVKFYKKLYKQKKIIDPIIVGVKKEKLYVFDGNHRLHSWVELYGENKKMNVIISEKDYKKLTVDKLCHKIKIVR